ncbi:glycosyltransferase [Miltoncostaea marina]|uniref:glycosyltransferase n=1 Tax=Miltoncostaea marina TaxID=2843215 RepID=UPI001C3C1EAC|nr:glycosyltransferase [Miltoncostaea marina]
MGTSAAPPLISVVLPTRDRRAMLATTLDRVLRQEDVSLEVVVVDDGSIDDTPRWLEEQTDSRVRTLRADGNGVARARNLGIAHARGEWVSFLDDDDIWAPHKLSTQLGALRRAGAQWSYCGVVDVDPAGRPLARHAAPSDEAILEQLLAGNVVHAGASTVMARTSLVRELGGFDERLFQCADWDMWIRLAAAGQAVACPEILVGYVLHPTNMVLTDPNDVIEEFRHVRSKHRDLAAARGVVIDSVRFHGWTATAFRRGRRRRAAAREYLRAAWAGRSPGNLLRAGASLLGGPGDALIGTLDRRHGGGEPADDTAPPDWLREDGSAREASRRRIALDEVERIRRSRRRPRPTQFDYLHIRRLVRDLSGALGALPPRPGGLDVLDVFCGSRPYDDLLPAGSRITGMDIEDRYGRADVVSSEFLPFGDDSFDVVMCIEAFHYAPDPPHAVTEIARVLRPGGHAVIAVPLVWEYDRAVLEHRWTGPSLAALFRAWDDVTIVENGGRTVAWATLTGEMLSGLETILARGPARAVIRATFAAVYVALNGACAAMTLLDERTARSGRTLPMNLLLTARAPS